MLFEMATGNHTFRIEKNHDDELDELVSMLNALAEKMHMAILKSGHVNPHYTYQSMVQATLILDTNFCIKSFTANVPTIFGFPPEKLFGAEFNTILAKQSHPLWLKIKEEIRVDNHFHNTVQLVYSRSNQLLMPTFCTISKLLYTDKIIVSSVTTVLQDFISDDDIAHEPHPRISDAEMVQNVYEYIKKHLEDPLPSTRELSILFGTNEFKLKDSFRHFFNTSIHQFYNEERLKKAHLLIQQTPIPVKSVAYMCGFNSYINFYKAFKKRFHYAPTELHRDNGKPEAGTRS